MLEGALQGGQAERLAEGFQVVIVKDKFRKAAEVTDGGGEFLDVVVTEIELPQSWRHKTKRKHLSLESGGH